MKSSTQTRSCTGGLRVHGRALIIGAAFVAGCGSDGGVEPIALEALPVTAQTVEAAIEFRTAGPIEVPASCTGTVLVNCANGTPGSPVFASATPSNLTVMETAPGRYSFELDLAVTTLQSVPITYSGVGCTVAVNTAAGASPTIHVTGTAEFTSHTADEELNRIDLVADASGVETADFAIGGNALCGIGDFASSYAISFVSAAVGDWFGGLCGAPGPDLFMECPEPQRTVGTRRAR